MAILKKVGSATQSSLPLDGRRLETQMELKDRALEVAAEGVTIADATLPDMPLIYANAGFERLTGYSIGEVLGRNCRFLQGSDTDEMALEEIRASIREERECLVEILNYRKDGTTFWNRLSITPVRDASGVLTHFIGVQSDISARRRAEEGLREANLELQKANDRMVGDLEAAARIQHSLLPEELPNVKGFQFAWDFRPCDELAGDTLNIVPLNEENSGIYIIDVSGHGVRSALLSVTLSHTLSQVKSQSALFSEAASSPDGFVATRPSEVGERLNQQFQMDLRRVQYFTMIYGILNHRTREFRYFSAGHPPAVLVNASGEARLLPAQGFPVGLTEQPHYQEDAVKLEPGDRLFLYTDGVIEAATDSSAESQFGIDRLVEVFSHTRAETLENSIEAVRKAVESWCGSQKPDDDLSILAVEASNS